VPLRPPRGALVSHLLDLVFPPHCVGCGASGTLCCATCVAGIQPPALVLCARCQRPLHSTGAAAPAGLCAHCQADGRGALSGLRVAARYEGMVRQAIWGLKYTGQRRLGEPLGDLLANIALELRPSVQLVVPVPLHPSRLRQRGYNQAELLARRCAAHLGLPVRSDLLARTRATPSQVGLGLTARQANVAGAFGATRRAPAVLAGRAVLLVDDVATSGATLTAAAQGLLAGGATSVWGLAVAQPALGADAEPARVGARRTRMAR
jgi:ComF family protein